VDPETAWRDLRRYFASLGLDLDEFVATLSDAESAFLWCVVCGRTGHYSAVNRWQLTFRCRARLNAWLSA
jgi:hypothetical protein